MCGCEPGFTCPSCRSTPGDWRYHAFPDDVQPDPKSRSTAPRGNRRYRRKVASPKQMQAIIAAKLGPCRVCGDSNGPLGVIEFHHVIPRDRFGDDVADNLVPVHSQCHAMIEARLRRQCRALLMSLTDEEYAYCVSKAGEGFTESIYGQAYSRGSTPR